MRFEIILFCIIFTICAVNAADTVPKFVFSHPKRKTWFQAVTACRKLKPANTYDIATIASNEDQIEIEKLFATKKTPKRFRTWKDQIWVGGAKLGTVFQWHATGEELDFSNWDDDEPNNKNDDEKCLALRNRVGTKLVWNDSQCDHKYYYMCKAKDGDGAVVAADIPK